MYAMTKRNFYVAATAAAALWMAGMAGTHDARAQSPAPTATVDSVGPYLVRFAWVNPINTLIQYYVFTSRQTGNNRVNRSSAFFWSSATIHLPLSSVVESYNFTIRGLGSGSSAKYWFYFKYGNSAILELTATIPADRPDKPVYTVTSADVTDTTIPLAKASATANASSSLWRHFFVSKTPLTFTDDQRDGITASETAHSFSINSGGATISVGGSVSTVGGTNRELKPNTKYYLYVTDWSTDRDNKPKPSDAHDITGGSGQYTLPAAPTGFGSHLVGARSVVLTDGVVVEDVTRRYFVFTSAQSGVNRFNDMASNFVKEGTATSGPSIAISGLKPNTTYHVYIQNVGATSGLVSTPLGVSFTTSSQARPPEPAYSVRSSSVRATSIGLKKDSGKNPNANRIRRFFVSETALTLDSNGEFFDSNEEFFDGHGLTLHGNFTVNKNGSIVIGDEKGAGNEDPVSGTNPPLDPNTQYYLYVSDLKSGQLSPSLAHDITGGKGQYTRPAAMPSHIGVPSGNNLQLTRVRSESFDVKENTRLHWVLIKEGSPVSDASVKGAHVRDTDIGSEIAAGRRVVNKGTLTSGSGQRIDFLSNSVALEGGTKYVFYWSVESTLGSTKLFAVFSGSHEVDTNSPFTTPQATPVTPSYSISKVAATTITLSGDNISGNITRRFFVHTSSLTFSSVGHRFDGEDGTLGGLNPFATFTITNGGASVAIGSGSPAANKALMPNTPYYIYVSDYDRDSGLVTASVVEAVSSQYTRPKTPTGITLTGTRLDPTDGTKARVSFSKATEAVSGTHRIFYASTDALNTHPGGRWDGSHFGTTPATVVATDEYLASVANADAGVEFPVGDPLDADTQYHFYAVDYNMTSGLQSLPFYVGGKALYTAPETSDAAVPVLTQNEGETTHEEITLDVSAIPANYTRAYYFSETDLVSINDGKNYFDSPGTARTGGF